MLANLPKETFRPSLPEMMSSLSLHQWAKETEIDSMAENPVSDSTSSWEDKCECRAQERTSNLQTVAGTCGVSQKAADAKPKSPYS